MIRALVGALLAVGCAGATARPTAGTAEAPEPGNEFATHIAPAPSGAATASPSSAASHAGSRAAPEPGPEPAGRAALAIFVERGKRQPVSFVGTVEAIRAPIGTDGLDAWTEVTLGPSPKASFHLSVSPSAVALPFEVGDRISAEIDCRKGGWHRVCDGLIRDAARQVLLVVSGSGSDELAAGFTVERGALTTSEVRPGPQKSVRHTHALRFESEGASVTPLPEEWKRLLVHGRSYLVTGFEESWEGARPPDARDHRSFGIVLEK